MAKKITPPELKASLEAEQGDLQAAAKEFASPDAAKAKKDSGMRRVALIPPFPFPGIDVQDGDGYVTITPKPRLVSVATANALLRAVKAVGLSEANVSIEKE